MQGISSVVSHDTHSPSARGSSDNRLRLDLAVPVEWGRIECVRETVARCLGVLFDEGDLRDAVSMVCAELLENAVKYGRPPGIRFSLQEELGSLVVSVTSQADAGEAHVLALLERVAWLKTFASAQEAYLAALEALYDDSSAIGDDAGGLGIVRVAHEGGCDVSVDTSRPGWLTVRAARVVASGQGGEG